MTPAPSSGVSSHRILRNCGGGSSVHYLGQCLSENQRLLFCANERHAFVRLPSLTKVESWDTGIELTDPTDARAYCQFVEGVYRASRKIESRRQVAGLPILAEPSDDEEVDG